MTQQICLIGYPLSSSWSPAMQQAALVYYRLNVTYQLMEVAPGALPTALHHLRAPQVLGFNVTMPYKETVMPLLDNIADDALIIGAVNTVVNNEGKLHGYNTDVHGARATLKTLGPGGLRVTLLGAGGAARAVVAALSHPKLCPSHITVVNRGRERSLSLKTLGASVGVEISLATLTELGKVLQTTDLLINCATDSSFALGYSFDCQVWDLNYGAKSQGLRHHCLNVGTPYRDGSEMLLHQGARAFELWTNLKAPLRVMRDALRSKGGLSDAK